MNRSVPVTRSRSSAEAADRPRIVTVSGGMGSFATMSNFFDRAGEVPW
ncbi:hypothetical protein ABZ863_15785 [Saccharomonospora sp. NPDC046836]